VSPSCENGRNSFWQDVVRGALLIVAVAIDRLRLRLSSA